MLVHEIKMPRNNPIPFAMAWRVLRLRRGRPQPSMEGSWKYIE